MEKVYSLPDLPLAPYSDVQALARRLLEYRDWSAVRLLLDELESVGDAETAKKVRETLIGWIPIRWPQWGSLVDALLVSLCPYMFSLDAAIELLEKTEWDRAADWSSFPKKMLETKAIYKGVQ